MSYKQFEKEDSISSEFFEQKGFIIIENDKQKGSRSSNDIHFSILDVNFCCL